MSVGKHMGAGGRVAHSKPYSGQQNIDPPFCTKRCVGHDMACHSKHHLCGGENLIRFEQQEQRALSLYLHGKCIFDLGCIYFLYSKNIFENVKKF
jgi:hypothetical protein